MKRILDGDKLLEWLGKEDDKISNAGDVGDDRLDGYSDGQMDTYHWVVKYIKMGEFDLAEPCTISKRSEQEGGG